MTPPIYFKALPLKWIYTIKRDLKGNIIRYKARLVTQGFFQVFGIDYTDTYSLVAKIVSVRILFAISVQFGLIIHAMDVDRAVFECYVRKRYMGTDTKGYRIIRV